MHHCCILYTRFIRNTTFIKKRKMYIYRFISCTSCMRHTRCISCIIFISYTRCISSNACVLYTRCLKKHKMYVFHQMNKETQDKYITHQIYIIQPYIRCIKSTVCILYIRCILIPDICHERHEYIRVNFFWPV